MLRRHAAGDDRCPFRILRQQFDHRFDEKIGTLLVAHAAETADKMASGQAGGGDAVLCRFRRMKEGKVDAVLDDRVRHLEERAGTVAGRDDGVHATATQTVFGEGPRDAEVMFVGEQPGDQEDISGRPFVGPAGRLLDQVIAEAGIDRSRLYVTNAVKHFKYEPRGKRRIHQKPNMGEVNHCRWWLDLEMTLVKPKLIVAMGATALAALTDAKQRLQDVRGKAIAIDDRRTLFVTVHPSYLLRIPDERLKADELARFREDMLTIQRLMLAAA